MKFPSHRLQDFGHQSHDSCRGVSLKRRGISGTPDLFVITEIRKRGGNISQRVQERLPLTDLVNFSRDNDSQGQLMVSFDSESCESTKIYQQPKYPLDFLTKPNTLRPQK
jgi:hypothetical protein